MVTWPLTCPYMFLLFWCIFRKQACWALMMLQAQIRKNPCTVWALCTGMAKERTCPLDYHNSFWRDTALLSFQPCHETEQFGKYKTSCSSAEMWKDGKPYLNLGHNQSSSTACPACSSAGWDEVPGIALPMGTHQAITWLAALSLALSFLLGVRAWRLWIQAQIPGPASSACICKGLVFQIAVSHPAQLLTLFCRG